MYTEALLHKNVTPPAETTATTCYNSCNSINQIPINISNNNISKQASVSGSVSKRFGYLSDDEDNESFVSADSVIFFNLKL